MKINVNQVRQTVGERQSFHFVQPAAKFADGSDQLWLDGQLEVVGEVVNTGQHLLVEGQVTGTAHADCHRCLREFRNPVTIPFAETFRPEPTPDSKSEGEEAIFFSGDEIDLTDLIRETVFLAEPIKMLCSEACKGLCRECGVDLNQVSCGCNSDSLDPRLEVLKNLLK
ncbi:MAG: DUF177 domain-containing protein [Negativicutes bacterium]|nr:DUF177 domain-containing protein [Negativicutes bacterium]